ncbi:MAG: hypothetical protein ACI965_001279 [Paraglaciecola sp.]|jgi:hypothetical protein
MLNMTKISAVLLTLGLSVTGTSHGEEVSLEYLVSHMLAQSVTTVKQDIRNDIQGAVLTATSQFSLYEEGIYATRTNISDIDPQIAETLKQETE